MKRSEVNTIISDVKKFFSLHHFMLPEWAFWPPSNWKGIYGKCSEIVDNKLGWDITDFGSGDFFSQGLALFTIRNGSWGKNDKLYCEKIMVADEEQETPMHFHWNKTEDIINRGGGNLVMELYNSGPDGSLEKEKVTASVDGILIDAQPGEKLILKPGQSICLKPGMYHRFYGEKGHGKVLIGEVSMVNDDASDNRFYGTVGRFPEIEEDEEPLHLLVNDYSRYI
jgi:D-lyxose ketol-isomerase